METILKNAEGEIIEVRISDDQQCSVEISKNAKGEYTYSAKVYQDNGAIMEEKLKAWTAVAEKRIEELKAGKH